MACGQKLSRLSLSVAETRWFARHGHDIPPEHIGPNGDEIALFLGAEANRAFDEPELETESVGGTPDPIEPDRTPAWAVGCQTVPLGNPIRELGFQSLLDRLPTIIAASEQNVCSSHV